jgi:N-acetyltransferase 10
MVKKKIDARVRVLIENGIKQRHRSMFVLVGDHGRDQVACKLSHLDRFIDVGLVATQVVNLHHMLSKASIKARPSVLWCYKKELGFST